MLCRVSKDLGLPCALLSDDTGASKTLQTSSELISYVLKALDTIASHLMFAPYPGFAK